MIIKGKYARPKDYGNLNPKTREWTLDGLPWINRTYARLTMQFGYNRFIRFMARFLRKPDPNFITPMPFYRPIPTTLKLIGFEPTQYTNERDPGSKGAEYLSEVASRTRVAKHIGFGNPWISNMSKISKINNG